MPRSTEIVSPIHLPVMVNPSDHAELAGLIPGPKAGAQSGRALLLPALLKAQESHGYISEEVAREIGAALRVPLADIHGVIEFYSMLHNQPVGRTMVRVCTSPPCCMLGGPQALQAASELHGVSPGELSPDGALTLEESPCLGLCDHAPAALVGTTPLPHIDRDLAWAMPRARQAAPLGIIGGEPRWLTGRCGKIPPTDLDAYIREGGYSGLQRAVAQMQPAEVVEMIKAAGLVGRGGAAFPTGLKWEYTAAAQAYPHYQVCNADESEPGTYKDRVLMEGDPFAVLEGMAVAGYAVGAEKGYLYIRGEYPRALEILSQATERAANAGYLGSNILGSPFSFEVEIRSGAGAYICGEETALFESIEGKRGFPRLKPPFPTTHGLFGKPTAINNVETLCAAAWVLAEGADAYRSIGTESSPGSKLFCVSGDVARPGVYEVPFGTSVRELLMLAGGTTGEVQAILMGGAAGSFARPDQLDLALSFEGLKAAGLSLGSGVVMVINRTRDMREVLRSLAEFFAHESCGKCLPCQLGTQRQLEILERVTQHSATQEDLEALRDVEFTMTYTSICGLGMTAGSAIASALATWPELFSGDGKRARD